MIREVLTYTPKTESVGALTNVGGNCAVLRAATGLLVHPTVVQALK